MLVCLIVHLRPVLPVLLSSCPPFSRPSALLSSGPSVLLSSQPTDQTGPPPLCYTHQQRRRSLFISKRRRLRGTLVPQGHAQRRALLISPEGLSQRLSPRCHLLR